VKTHETYLSTQQSQACPDPRFSRPHGHQERPQGHQSPSRQGARPPDALRHCSIGSQRFPRSARLLKGADYRRVFADPRRSSDRYFTVLYRPSGRAEARLGLAVAKKHLRRAVARNRIKRLIRESFRHHRQALAGLDLVVLVKPGIDAADNRSLHASLARHWKRLQAAADSSAHPQDSENHG